MPDTLDGGAPAIVTDPLTRDQQEVKGAQVVGDPKSSASKDGIQASVLAGDPVESTTSQPPVGVRGWIVWVWRKLKDIKLVLDAILVQLGGSAAGEPIIVTELYDVGGKRPKKKRASVVNQKRVLLLKTSPPTGKKWFITSWKGSGTGSGFYEFQLFNETNKTATLLEGFGSVAGWSGSGKVLSIVADTVDKIQGVASLAVTLKFSDKGIQSGEKITKTLSPTQDWSSYQFLGIFVKGDPLNSNVTVGMKIYQGGSNYTFTDQLVGSGSFIQLLFDLNEITTFDLTAVDKIEVYFFENVDLKKNVTVRLDQLDGISGISIDDVDQFFINHDQAGAKSGLQPNQVLFTEGAGVVVQGAQSVALFVQNLDAGVRDYEMGLFGRQSDI